AGDAQAVSDTVDRWRDLPLVVTAPASGITTTEPAITISGNAYLNAGVTVNGIPVEQDAQGDFDLPVDLAEGENHFAVSTGGEGELARTVNLTIIREAPAVELEMKVMPTVLSRKSHGKRIAIRVEGAEVEADSLLLNGQLRVIDLPGQGNPGYGFDLGELMQLVPEGAEEFTLTLTGRLKEGSMFIATITVKIVL
ncbi:MAG TPA: hypothetical protein VD902_16605, partial [Symbiobacteriaceae bacterium]|nr:hypothetical protein [Symbiobacteriaceae bacterium]